MTIDQIPTNVKPLLNRTEDQWFDRKSGRIAAKDLAKPLVAFANAEGGYLVVGIHSGKVDGVSESKLNDLRQAASDFTEPPVRAHFDQLTEDGRTVLVISVSPGDLVHRTNTGDVFLRVGDESRKLGYREIQELEFDRGAGPYDGTQAGVEEDALDWSALEEFTQRIGASSPRKALEARNLLTRDGQITVAALLLFGRNPQHEFPQAYVRVLRYADVTRRAGAQQTLIEGADLRIEGTLINQISSGADAIQELMPKRRALGPHGVFQSISQIPKDAWMEGLVNAVVHRSYSMMGDHIRVEIFPDRIEFHNPGRFPGIVDLEHPLQIARHARNPRIARVCADLGYAQELGEGVRRMYQEMAQQRLSDPKFIQRASGVSLELSTKPALSKTVSEQLTASELALYEAIRPIHEGLRTGEIADLVGISRPTALRRLRKLRGLNLIHWDGSSERDPSALWIPNQ